MKKVVLLSCCTLLMVTLAGGSFAKSYAQSISPRSLFDLNVQPAVATDGNNNFTITWGYMGLGHLPGILAKRYDSNGQALDNTGFWVNPAFGAPSLLNFDPDIVTDSANNSIIAWCTFGLSYPSSSVQVVYTKVAPQLQSEGSKASPDTISAIFPQQDDEIANLLSIPFAPAIAIGSDDTLAIVWSYLNLATAESGIYLVVVGPDGGSCRVEKSAPFSAIATALRLPELARPEMDECRVEFRLGGGRDVMPVVSLKGAPTQVTGTGSVVLASGALDFDMTLAVQTALLERLPVREVRAAFEDRGDGYGVLPFALRGATARPETGLAVRLARAAAGEAAKGKLRSILDKVF